MIESQWAVAIVIGSWMVADQIWTYWRRKTAISLEQRIDDFVRNPDSMTGERLFRDAAQEVRRKIQQNDSAGMEAAAHNLRRICQFGAAQSEEGARTLTSLLLACMRSGRMEAMRVLLTAMEAMLRQDPDGQHEMALQDMGLLCHSAYKSRQAEVLAGVARSTIAILEHTTMPGRYVMAAEGLAAAGVSAMRMKDAGAAQEIFDQCSAGFARAEGLGVGEVLAPILERWLHQMMKAGDAHMFGPYREMAAQLWLNNALSAVQQDQLVRTWCQTAGIACRNPRSPFGPWILQLVLDALCRHNFAGRRPQTVSMVFQILEQQFARQGFRESFFVFRPVLECGRKLLIQHQAFQYWRNEERRELLHLLVRSCVSLTASVARKEIMLTPADIVAEIHQAWRRQSDGGEQYRRSMKRLCQLIYLYWQKTWWRQAKRQGETKQFAGSAAWEKDTTEILQKIL